MKALIIADNNQLEFVDKEIPIPKDHEVLIKINAVALNHRDQFIREGKYPGISVGTILGSDASGTVLETGKNVDSVWKSKEVLINPNVNWGENSKVQSSNYHILGTPSDGLFCEYVTIDAQKIAEKPAHLSLENAAALPLGGMTAFRALFHHGRCQKGENILISGVGGGVAQFAFQFALAKGANVYVTSSDETKRTKSTELGAKGAFNYKDSNWVKEAKSKSGGFDLAIDSAAGEGINDLIKLMNPAGRIVFYGATQGKTQNLDVHRMFWNQITLQGSTMANDDEFKEMLAYVRKNRIEPIIDSVRPFNEIITAFDKMKAGDQFGKLVISLLSN
ncbi:quinone oxidoreductase family protein [Marivirga sp.]|uniref:quinone oxidoreductase family protein n=1 Tax=Marivirga sp. TaxID=2018662 RepID=UPI002D7FD7BB|nr:zinc-binding dehydrogenase [Marivirga sp.]HET8858680.1 zinc-binding dehydrogenase [Marivirga sp.]